jgi:hypothetical protein
MRSERGLEGRGQGQVCGGGGKLFLVLLPRLPLLLRQAMQEQRRRRHRQPSASAAAAVHYVCAREAAVALLCSQCTGGRGRRRRRSASEHSRRSEAHRADEGEHGRLSCRGGGGGCDRALESVWRRWRRLYLVRMAATGSRRRNNRRNIGECCERAVVDGLGRAASGASGTSSSYSCRRRSGIVSLHAGGLCRSSSSSIGR